MASDKNSQEFMRRAIEEAKKARAKGEVPIGAIIVKKAKALSVGHNQVEEFNDATLHAEIIAIRRASKKLKNWRLTGSTLYVTLEPCDMCMTAIKISRIDRVIFGSYRDNKPAMKVDSEGGLLKDETDKLLKSFFKGLR